MWTDIVSALASAFTALAVVSGGLIAFRHYRLEAPHAERADLAVEGDLFDSGGVHLLRTTLCLANSGKIALHFCTDDRPLVVARAYTSDMIAVSPTEWLTVVAGEYAFTKDTMVEATESITETIVLAIPRPPPDVLLYQLLFRVAVHPHRRWGGKGDCDDGFVWHATALVPVGGEPLGSSLSPMPVAQELEA